MEVKIIDTKVVSVKTINPDVITGAIERSKIVGEVEGLYEVWINFGLGEMHILNNLGFRNVPSPIETRYTWPGLYKPFEHQRTTAAFLTLNRRAFCLNEMGTGKTCSVIWAFDYLMTLGIIKRALIICPLSIMDAAWHKDLFITAMHRTIDIAHGDKHKRKKIIRGDSEVVVINFDGVEIVEEDIARSDFDLIVVDEATYLKNVSTNRWKAVNRLVRPTTWLWLLTGTPAAQSPMDAYGLIKLVSPSKVPRAVNAFRDIVQVRVAQYKFVNRPNVEGMLYSMMQPAIRFTKEECLDLPELTYQTRNIPLSSQQEKYYKTFKKELLIQAAGEEITAANAAVMINKLLQLSSGSIYADSGDIIEFDITPRATELINIIKETSHKTIVFVMFKHTIALVDKLLTQEGYSTAVIHGGVNEKKRADIFNKFQTTDSPQVLIIQPQAASHGVTLHAANTIVWWGVPMSLETYKQGNARIHRAGQINKCSVVHLIGSPAEHKVLETLENKNMSQTKLLDLYKDVLL